MVGPTEKPSAYDGSGGGAASDGGGVFGDPKGPGKETGGAVGPGGLDPNRASTNPSVDGKFSFDELYQSPDKTVPFDFEREIAKIDARFEEDNAGKLNFGVDPETGEFTDWKDLEAQGGLAVGDSRYQAESGSLANRDNDLTVDAQPENRFFDDAPSSAGMSTLDASADSGGAVASADSSSDGGGEDVNN